MRRRHDISVKPPGCSYSDSMRDNTLLLLSQQTICFWPTNQQKKLLLLTPYPQASPEEPPKLMTHLTARRASCMPRLPALQPRQPTSAHAHHRPQLGACHQPDPAVTPCTLCVPAGTTSRPFSLQDYGDAFPAFKPCQRYDSLS